MADLETVHATIDHTGITGAGGSVATDAIWDAAGDLAVGSGANTAAKLAKGANGTVLTVTAGAVGWAAPASGSSAVPTNFVKRTSGALALTDDASWHDVPTISDLSIAAVAGDVLEVALSGVVDNTVRVEVKLVTSGNFVGPGESATQGIAGWANRIAGAGHIGGSGPLMYVVQSGDISGGNVALRLRYTTNSSGATQIFATAGVGPLFFSVKNLKQ